MQPFIIWTQRRTGGTTLNALLVECSGLPAWQDEAFNMDRELGGISAAWDAAGDTAVLEAGVAAAVRQRKTLKHCLDTVAWPISRALLHASQAAGYRHVLLLRLGETERQLSLALAELTGAWGPKDAPARHRALEEGRLTLPPADASAMSRQVYADAAALGRLVRGLLSARIRYETVFYEDLFTGAEDERRRHFATLAHHLELDLLESDAPLLRKALMDRGQNTRAIYRFLPNLAEAVAAIEAMT